MAQIITTSDGFQWEQLISLHEAINRLGHVYRLYDDGSDALVESIEELRTMYNNGEFAYLEIGFKGNGENSGI